MTEELYIKHSFDFLNTLYALGQGEFVYLNILSRFGNNSYESEINSVKSLIDYCGKWANKLWDNQLILEDSTERKEIISRLEKVKENFSAFIEEANSLIVQKKYQEEDCFKLLAILGRHAYTREAFIQGLITFGEKRNIEELTDYYMQQLPSVNSEINDINQRVHLFETSKETKDIDNLFSLCESLPAIFEEQLSGLNELVNNYQKDGGEV